MTKNSVIQIAFRYSHKGTRRTTVDVTRADGITRKYHNTTRRFDAVLQTRTLENWRRWHIVEKTGCIRFVIY